MSGDTQFPKVALLLLGNNFTDLSYNQSAVHPGPVTLTSAFAGVLSSSYWFQRTFTGVSFSVDHPANALIHENEDFTVEVVAYVQRNVSGGAIFSNRTAGGNADGILLAIDANARPFARVSANGALQIAIDSPNRVMLDGLHTFKLHRKNGLWGLSVDGVPQRDLRHQPRWTGEVPHGNKLYVGCDPYTTGFVGGINGVRLTVGVARDVGSYTPSIETWPIYATEPNILFGPLSSDVCVHSAAVQLSLSITNADTVSVAALDGRGASVGSGWAIVDNNISGQSSYSVTGVAPSALSDFFLVITATTTQQYGALTRSQSYRLRNTLAGVLSQQQSLIAGVGGARLWLDSSDATTITLSGSDILQIINKIDSIPFVAASARPKPQLNTSAMNHNSIRFVENSSSGLVAAAPIVLSDSTSDSTVILVGKYVGTQLGQGAGLFQISYSDDDARQDGTAAWILSSSNTGVANGAASMYDSTFRQNGIGTDTLITPGEAFIVVWNTASNKADIWLQQRKIAEIELAGTLGFWSSVNAAIAFIGGSLNPNGAFIAMGELIALANDMTTGGNNSLLEQLVSFLNKKWSVYPNVPFAATPSMLTGYASNPFAATTILTDATSAEVSATDGSSWVIAETGSQMANEWLITGLLPSSPTTIALTITTHNGGISATDVFNIVVRPLPDTPIVQTPFNLQAQAGAGFATLLNIFSSDSVTVTGSDGSNWAIAQAAEAETGNYIITGVAPDTPGSISLTVTATKHDSATDTNVQTVAVFTVVVSASFVTELDQYQVDMTGILPANLITFEKQTLTPANGVDRQLLVPIFSPYFGDSVALSYYAPDGSVVAAIKDVDYVSVGKLSEVSQLCGAEVFTSVLSLNPQLRGTVLLQYQTLGGGWGVDRQTIMRDLSLLASQSSFVGWEAVTGKPIFFPVSTHTLDIQNNTVGLSPLVAVLEGVRAALANYAESDVVALRTHALLNGNPHNVSQAQIGLGNVSNYPPASGAEAQAGTSSQRFLTPYTAALAIDALMPVAQDTVAGKFALNLGVNPGDDADITKPLTGSGVVALLSSPSANALNSIFATLINQAEQSIQADPSPLTYPLWWKGIYCADAGAFASAVRSYTGLRALRFNSLIGVFYFPVGFTIPSLVTTGAYSAVDEEAATVLTPVALPLKLTS